MPKSAHDPNPDREPRQDVLESAPEDRTDLVVTQTHVDMVPIPNGTVRHFYETGEIGPLLSKFGFDLRGQLEALREARQMALENGKPKEVVAVVQAVQKMVDRAAERHIIQSTSKRIESRSSRKPLSVREITKNVESLGELPEAAKQGIRQAGSGKDVPE